MWPFNWLTRKPAPILPPRSSGPSRPQLHGSSRGTSRRSARAGAPPDDAPLAATPPVSASEQRKSERVQRRECLYQIVRDAMPRAGLLSSNYKFKVLALDQRGRQFIVLIDLHETQGKSLEQLPEAESIIVRSARARYEIQVTAVYWRLSETGAVEPAHGGTEVPTHPMPLVPRADPLEAAEVLAFQRALAAGARAPVAPEPVPVRQPAHYALLTGYEDTEVIDDEPLAPALSGTQYGELR